MAGRVDPELSILGGGLAGGLIAYALSQRRPEARVALIERGNVLGGNHIWSFFDSDIADADRWIIEPFVSHHWNGYEVRFPGHRRTLGNGYNAIEFAGSSTGCCASGWQTFDLGVTLRPARAR